MRTQRGNDATKIQNIIDSSADKIDDVPKGRHRAHEYNKKNNKILR